MAEICRHFNYLETKWKSITQGQGTRIRPIRHVKRKDNEEEYRELKGWATSSRPTSASTRSQKEKKGAESLFEEMAENCPDLGKETDIQTQ